MESKMHLIVFDITNINVDINDAFVDYIEICNHHMLKLIQSFCDFFM